MPDPVDQVLHRVHSTADGLARLVAEAEATWRARATASGEDLTGEPDGEPRTGTVSGWRPFEDAFPTFYQFTNRPRG
jgi:hypothetical protein